MITLVQLNFDHYAGTLYSGVALCPKGWACCQHMGQDAPFCAKIIKSFRFYDIIYFTKKIFAYQEYNEHIDCFAQDCSDSIANALELLQFYTEPLIWL